MHLPVLFKFNQQITKYYVVHSMLMELCLLLVAQTLLQEYVFLLSTAPVNFWFYCTCELLILLPKGEFFFHQKCWFQVWNACKSSSEEHDQPNHEMDVLSGHENDVNYVQFSGCVVSKSFSSDSCHTTKEENNFKLRNSWSVSFSVMEWSFTFSYVIFQFIHLLSYMFLLIVVVVGLRVNTSTEFVSMCQVHT